MTKSSQTRYNRRSRIKRSLAVKAEKWGADIVDAIVVCKDVTYVIYDADTGDQVFSSASIPSGSQ